MYQTGEFKDTWRTENKWTTDDKLKADFIKIRLEITLDNKVVRDFLAEALIMRKFNHPHILSMYGVSVHDSRPCIILPLMKNGNLNNYLKSCNKVSVHTTIFVTLWLTNG